MEVTNTQAYYDTTTITAIKNLIVQVPFYKLLIHCPIYKPF